MPHLYGYLPSSPQPKDVNQRTVVMNNNKNEPARAKQSTPAHLLTTPTRKSRASPAPPASSRSTRNSPTPGTKTTPRNLLPLSRQQQTTPKGASTRFQAAVAAAASKTTPQTSPATPKTTPRHAPTTPRHAPTTPTTRYAALMSKSPQPSTRAALMSAATPTSSKTPPTSMRPPPSSGKPMPVLTPRRQLMPKLTRSQSASQLGRHVRCGGTAGGVGLPPSPLTIAPVRKATYTKTTRYPDGRVSGARKDPATPIKPEDLRVCTYTYNMYSDVNDAQI